MSGPIDSSNEIKRNQRGGKRPGAGRKPGSQTKRTQEIVARATASGITPLEYLIETLRDTQNDAKIRFAAAVAAAPYVHPRLSNATVTTTVKRSVDELTTDELIAALNEAGDSGRVAEAEVGLGEPDSFH